ncbi:hypothetical protein F5Y18DRAFT_422124 [Xylariaceae sp. FL1019]|nr:hypothetical protein F5Y18DRAFT_422124 [Xylariaceae sp. FL1019]
MDPDDEVRHIQIFTAQQPHGVFPFPTLTIRILTTTAQEKGTTTSLSEYDNTLLAGIFFGISAALLVIALPLAIMNYCRARRQGALQI